MDVLQSIANKILDKNNKIIKAKLKSQFIQKVFTKEEQTFINKLEGDSTLDKLEKALKNKKRKDTKKKEFKDYKYYYDKIYFSSANQVITYIYRKENKIRTTLDKMRKWFYDNYDSNYLKQFKLKSSKTQKRRVVEIYKIDDIETIIFPLRNKNIKVQYHCSKCGKIRICSPKTVLHFNNLLCRACRK